MWKLVLHEGRADAKGYALTAGSTTIGRTPDSGIRILHASLSRQHARIDITPDQATVTDLGSLNGTFVNGVRVERHPLAIGDELKIGSVVLRLVDDQEQPRPQPSPSQPIFSMVVSAPAADALNTLTERRGQTALRLQSQTPDSHAQDKLRILLEVSRLLSSPEGVQRLPDQILELLSRILDYDRAAVLVVHEETGKLEPRAVKRSGSEDGPIYSRHIVESVQKGSIAALFADAKSDARVAGVESIAAQSIRASMCVPLKATHDVLGVLYVDSQSRADHFTQADLEFLVAFASQAAVALENARLYRRLESEAVQRNRLLRFFPPRTIQRVMLSGGPSLETADADVTALFSDISGFTAMSSSLQPRDVVALLNEYFPVMADIVFAHEGTLEKYIGDALMAIWGAPFAHPDDADRAVSAAVAMQYAVRRLNAEWSKNSVRPPLKIHIGLNSGPVAAGFLGSQSYLQYAAIGDATNVASRVCTAAPAGEIFISESTLHKLHKKDLPVEKLPPIEVKGKSAALSLYRVRWDEVPAV